MNRLRRWVGIALLGPMLVLAVSASSFIGIRCRMSGMVSLDACCPAAVPGPVPLQSSIDAPGCCERVVVRAVKLISSALSRGPGEGAIDPPQVTLIAVVASSDSVRWPVAALAIAPGDPPAGIGPPLRLLKRSFLI